MATYPGVIINLNQHLLHAIRNPQIKQGFLTNGGNQTGGSEPIQTPRKTPLESTWKRANATQFE
ncbi:hypothetical protein KD909_15015 (plasmid) [Exiguobacterium sp. PFWT01]|uniref:hypothetical protein n=1 Tax=Exiguobacterium sp. PFWT01 TaxID=2829816 RepID=UPI001BA91BB6|nr:hypothetical protein [Exiguobacterium sp. PFWT01]QUP88738.1 hypothetical protein KD909_15015 [Exiguobacterium sp. PFWT01]